MSVLLRPAGDVPCASRLRRGRSTAGNWCRIVLTVFIIATACTTFLTNTIHPIPFSIASVITPSANPLSRRDSISFPRDSRNSTVIEDFKKRTMKEKEIGRRNKVPDSTRAELKRHVKESIPSGIVVPASIGQKLWELPPYEAILYAKREIENAPLVADDPYLYAPVFRNLSMFKRSYELMEKILKVYIYPDGSKPIFHTPELQGIYASEGWFMKLMQESREFVVKDPDKAHLFYLPYSSRRLRDTLYTPGSHNIKPLAIFLRDYVNNISSKYPFWNRTRGSDHFLVACHDWGPYSTTAHTELCKNSIKAVCNADTSERIFIRGKDVSLPETSIRTPKKPLKNIGGKRVSQRPILAFYAGLMHGRVRPLLEKLWGNDTAGDIRIFRRLPSRVSRNMSYIDHMKASRFCICPMGYEVNSPRIVEAIYYECVPVIIADNFVLPFEQVLNWTEFSVVIAEKDIGDLKDVLMGIPLRRYVKMQECVKKVQKHFLWHAKPEKYDLFHMILHSVWSARLNQVPASL